MRILLDTHAVLWALEGGKKLSKTARDAIEDPENVVLVSAVSAWEIAIKKALGRLVAPDDFVDAVDEAGFVRRPIGFGEVRRFESVPRLHGDPFDRMLVAHALEEGARFVTRDPVLARYAVEILW